MKDSQSPTVLPSNGQPEAEPSAAREPLPWEEISRATAMGRWVLQDHPGLNERTAKLVRTFAFALADKLRAAERKYGYSDGWATSDWEAECQRQLQEHVTKGDPLDVAAYAAFCWFHRWPSASPATPAEPGWQPISSAPRDGTRIDIWADGTRWANVAWQSQHAAWGRFERRYKHTAMIVYTSLEPTHWMPLPPPPVEAATPAHAELSPGNSSDLRGEEG